MSKIKISAAAFFFIFCFAFSFPFVIPGSSEPVFLHQFMGWALIFPVLPLFFHVVNSCQTFKKQVLAVYLITMPANAFVFYWIFYSLKVIDYKPWEIDTASIGMRVSTAKSWINLR